MAKKVTYPALTEDQQGLVRDNLKFVYKIASQYNRVGHFEDMIAEGNLGLCIAAIKFDPTRKIKFTTYSAHWIRAKIIGYLLRTHGPTHITSSDRKLFFAILRAQSILTESPDELSALAEQLGIDHTTMATLLARVKNRDVMLDAPQLNGRMIEMVDNDPLPDASVADAEERVVIRKRIQRAMSYLGPRERRIIQARLLTDNPRTLEELGDALGGLSRERVRQIEQRAKDKLRGLLQVALLPSLASMKATPATTAAPAATGAQARARRA